MSLEHKLSWYVEWLAQRCVDLMFAAIPRPMPTLAQVEEIRIIAHRGSHLRHPENTLAAFDHAILNGADGIEMDVRWTQDDHAVIGHDENCARIFSSPIILSQVSRAELRSKVPLLPTFEEVVRRYTGSERLQGTDKPPTHLMIELKATSHHGGHDLSSHGFSRARLQAIAGLLQDLTPGADYHLMCLDPAGLAFIEASEIFPSHALLSIALTNTGEISRLTLPTGWAGLTGHYLLIGESMRRRHASRGQHIGVGFVSSLNGLKRECSRDVRWIFSNDVPQLAAHRRQLLETLRLFAGNGATTMPSLGRGPLILILGALTTLSPVSIDMYLPAFQLIANDLHSTTAQVSLSLSSYFVGLAVAQLFYGPLLDRFGRKPPVIIGLLIYAVASVACLTATSVPALIGFRGLQAIGGCGAQVGAMAMVRDFFPAKESAKIFSLLILILGVSPMLAPSVGAFIVHGWGWHAIFGLLFVICLLLTALVHFVLPEGHVPDRSVVLRPRPILRGFGQILKDAQFSTFAFSGAFSFAGLFLYVTCSPILFMKLYQVTAGQYGAIFAFLSIGFIGSSQLNVLLARRHRSEKIYQSALIVQVTSAVIFVISAALGWLSLPGVLSLFFIYLAGVGTGSPNATALALAPFSKNAGSAAALVGFLQMGIGAVASATVGWLEFASVTPAAVLLLISSLVGLLIFMVGKSRIIDEVDVTEVVGGVH